MMKRDEKRNLLTKSILEAARDRISDQGLAGLRARDIAADAGCSLGSLYNAYTDIDDLILHVNSRTMSSLSEWVGQSVNEYMAGDEILLALAESYLDFAIAHANLWGALFGHSIQDNGPVPDWYRNKTDETFKTIVAPLLKLRPDLEPQDAMMMVRTLFSAVHGIVSLYLQQKLVAVDEGAIRRELKQFVQIYSKGVVRTL